MLLPVFAAAALLALPATAVAVEPLPVPAISSPAASTLVTSTFVITGRVAAGVTEVRVTGAASAAVTILPADAEGATFTAEVAVRYGRDTLAITAGDGASWSAPITLVVWQLGKTPVADRFVLVDKSDFMLYVARSGVVIASYPVAIGTYGTRTPIGTFYLGRPVPPGSGGAVWGPFRMRLNKKTWVRVSYTVHVGKRHVRRWRRVLRLVGTSYYIHGTNEPDSIGTAASHGCVRMWNSNLRVFRTLTYKYELTVIRS
jgi:lipoprotein-anchoring transpeptidase ErfK/SrfK